VTGHEPAVDLAAVMDRIGGDEELLRELVGLYVEDEQRLVEELVGAVRDGDSAGVRRSAHTLKGAVSNFCALDAWSAAQALEDAGRDGRVDQARALLDALRAELARVREVLSPYLP
jgi:two-component system, sensor histidine kinase and response regulator